MILPFEIADKSTEKRLTWYDAQDYVKTLGNGWRLPFLNELDLMYQNENNLNSQGYWSSTEFDIDHAWIQYFATGNHSNLNKNGYYYIRAIRDLK